MKLREANNPLHDNTIIETKEFTQIKEFKSFAGNPGKESFPPSNTN